MNKRKHQQLFEALLVRLEVKYRRKLITIFRRNYKALAAQYVETRSGAIDSFERSLRADIRAYLEVLYEDTGNKFYALFDAEHAASREKKEIVPTVFRDRLLSFIRFAALEKAVSITSTQVTGVRKIIREGLEGDPDNDIKPLSVAQIGKEIRKSVSNKAYEADRIARTEVHGAANQASSIAAEVQAAENDIIFDKEWSATLDDRTRDTHADVDGDTVTINETFTVGDSQMLFPGDPNGGASEVISCRCSVLYVPRI